MTFSAKIDKKSPKCTEEGEGVTGLGLSTKIYHLFTPSINDIYQEITLKICLSLFGWKESILYKEHIVHCQSVYCWFLVG